MRDTTKPQNIVCRDYWAHVYPPGSRAGAHGRSVSARLILKETGCI